ncbi:MAG: hypothetical protein ACREI8_08585 [Myxococcota bacterium]
MIARDTSPEAHAAQLAAYARIGPARRVELAFELSEQMREVAVEGILHRNPELSRKEARRILWRRLLGGELFDAAFPAAAPIGS